MHIDLRQDAKRLRRFVEQRVKEFPLYTRQGPGEDDARIRLIVLGYQFEQAGWAALAFDTRPDAASDGEWQSFIEGNDLPLDPWFKAFDGMLEGRGPLRITLCNGKSKTFDADSDMEDISECFGQVCRSVLQQARKDGAFDKLPLARECHLAVEDHDGFFGWCDEENDFEVAQEAIQKDLLAQARKTPRDKRIQFWIKQCEQLAQGRGPISQLLYSEDFVLEQLSELGEGIVEPLLKFAVKWASEPEFRVEGQHLADAPHSYLLCMIFQSLPDHEFDAPGAERLLQRYLALAAKVPPTRKPGTKQDYYGPAPRWAAHLLHNVYPGYPEPKVRAVDNRLQNAEKFIAGPIVASQPAATHRGTTRGAKKKRG